MNWTNNSFLRGRSFGARTVCVYEDQLKNQLTVQTQPFASRPRSMHSLIKSFIFHFQSTLKDTIFSAFRVDKFD